MVIIERPKVSDLASGVAFDESVGATSCEDGAHHLLTPCKRSQEVGVNLVVKNPVEGIPRHLLGTIRSPLENLERNARHSVGQHIDRAKDRGNAERGLDIDGFAS